MKRALVVGGGPCGIFAVGALLKHTVHITWVDKGGFQIGRLPIYSSVPANTRNDYLISAFENLPALAFDSCDGPRELLQQNVFSTANLGTSVEALEHATFHLLSHPRVNPVPNASVKQMVLDDINVHVDVGTVQQQQQQQQQQWNVRTEDNDGKLVSTFSVDSVILCLGARPRTPTIATLTALQQHGIELIDHDDPPSPHHHHLVLPLSF